jgi:hypothetical protein
MAMAAIVASAVQLSGCGKANAQSTTAPKRDLDVTVYKEDFAEIQDSRTVHLAAGTNQVELDNVSKSLDPKSVVFSWPSNSGPQVTSNTYDLGVGDTQSMLKRFVGQDVQLVWRSQNGTEGSKVDGTLKMAGDGLVLQVGDKYYINPDGTIIAPDKENVVTTPTLSVSVDAPTVSDSLLRTSYLTRGMSWSADYVGTLAPDSDRMRIECWATVTNETGVAYPGAHVTLVAGDPNRAVVSGELAKAPYAGHFSGGAPAAPMGREVELNAPRAEGELYAYKIASPANLGQSQMNRVRILSSESVPIVRDYSIALTNQESEVRQNAQLSISLSNNESSGLGLPLPEGTMRVYETQSDRQAYVGAAPIGDTPKGERVSLPLSSVFDVYAKSKMTSLRIPKRHLFQRSYRCEIHNEKSLPVTVRIVDSNDLLWKPTQESARSERLDANTLQWKVPVPAGGQTVLTYTLEYRRH